MCSAGKAGNIEATLHTLFKIDLLADFSLMIGLCCLADPIINIVLTDRWSPAAVLLQLLCIAYMWYPVINFNYLVLNAVGRTDYVLKSEVLKKSIL